MKNLHAGFLKRTFTLQVAGLQDEPGMGRLKCHYSEIFTCCCMLIDLWQRIKSKSFYEHKCCKVCYVLYIHRSQSCSLSFALPSAWVV